MAIKLGVVMDNMATVNYKKDSTLAMLWEADRRGYQLYYLEQKDLLLRDSKPYGNVHRLTMYHDANHWFDLGEKQTIPLADLNIILMRKDPPFNAEYIYATYLLEHAEKLGVLVANKPQSLRDANEKLFATDFPQCCPPNLVTCSIEKLNEFWQEHKDIVCKPLDSMGGDSIFRLRELDVNAQVVFHNLTHAGKQFIMAQKFIPDIIAGDKRILLIDGDPFPFALARVPQGKDWRGNLAVGAEGKVQPLTARDQWICEQVGSTLRAKGLYFVGIDVIGDYLTEINVTSPTGIRELDQASGLNISALLFDRLEHHLG